MGPDVVISPLPAPWLGLGGDDFLGSLSLGVTVTFLEGGLSFSSAFLLGTPFSTALGADEDTPSFPFSFFSSSFLRAETDALTKAFYLVASISVKDKRREVKHKDDKEETKRNEEGKLTTIGVFVQPTCYWRQLWTPIVSM